MTMLDKMQAGYSKR